MKIDNELRSAVWTSEELYGEEFSAQPDGTATFILSVNGIQEWYDPATRDAVRSVLTKTKKSQFYYCYPDAVQWTDVLIPHFELPRAKTEAEIKDWVSELRKDFIDRVHALALPTYHYFHPAGKTIFQKLPATAVSNPRLNGLIEFSTPAGKGFIKLNKLVLGDMYHWLMKVLVPLGIDLERIAE